ncbi:hypothetical protein [Dysgonomonas sp. ZJ709]|uniref:hypothetical protein n=1 Tax=Dysgonomonas sp. ZJ709 TaxID=2709797 RepID=UPI0013ECE9CD|nr:hypothetical protein [Dysgonomonas sp. ZJ709]
MFIERRDKNTNYYKVLQSRTLDLLQHLSGNVWTDFNVHDPGVTIADIFNYGLYELHYIFQFPFETYLSIEERKELAYHRKGFFSSGYIFSHSIVTISDYERLITDSITEVEACRISLNDDMLYHIEVQLTVDADKEQVSNSIERLYHSNRNLCENLGEISIVSHIGSPEADKFENHPQTLGLRRPDSHHPKMPQNYYSIQNHFPECYGISERGFPSGVTEEYKAKVSQLKAYLLIFDYLLADTENQAKNIGVLLDLSKKIPDKETLSINIRNVEELVDKKRMEASNIHSDVFWHIQKSRFLDALDSIYGEDTRKIYNDMDLPCQNEKRADIISAFPELNKNRFRSFNIFDGSDKIAGIRQTIAAMLGYDAKEEIPLSNFFAHYRLRLLEDSIFFTKYKYKLSVDIVEETSVDEIEKVQEQDILYKEEDYKELSMRISILWHNLLYESFLVYGSNIENYRLVHQREKGYLLVFKVPRRNDWFVISPFYEKEALIKTANLFCQFIRHLNVKSQTFYLIEHILLNDDIKGTPDYNKLTIVIPRWAKAIYSKAKYEELLRNRLPAHIQVEFGWFAVGKMYKFEEVYYKWRKAIADRNQSDIVRFSGIIKSIIDKK